MYALSGLRLQAGSPHLSSIALHAADAEGLLVCFLTELLWIAQKQHLGFDKFSIQVNDDYDLQAQLRGSTILSLDKEIKAVTYHNLAIQTTSHGLRTCIVFDV
jgi:SHS2 domain-containing protein